MTDTFKLFDKGKRVSVRATYMGGNMSEIRNGKRDIYQPFSTCPLAKRKDRCRQNRANEGQGRKYG